MVDPRRSLRRRIEVELVEADVEIGFNLVDLAGQEFQASQSSAVTRVLQDADEVVKDIEQRLSQLDAADRVSFEALVVELRREVAEAKSKYASSAD